MPDIRCDLCEQASSDFVIGLILTGDQTFVCVRCLPGFTEAVVKTLQTAGADQSETEWYGGQLHVETSPRSATEAQEAATTAQVPPGAPEAVWEDDYPQPALEAPRRAKGGRKSAPAEATEAETAASLGE